MYTPSKQELERIKLLEKIKNDDNTLAVKDIASIFTTLLFGYFKSTQTGKNVAVKVTEEELTRFITGFGSSFLSSIYVTAAKDEEEQKRRTYIAQLAMKDTLVEINKNEKK